MYIMGSALWAENFLEDSDINKVTLSNGIRVWMYSNDYPSEMVSIRVVWKNGEESKIFSLDCFSDEEAEIENFLEATGRELFLFPGEVGVIGVGQFLKEALLSHVEKSFVATATLYQEERTHPISITPLEGHSSGVLRISYPPLEKRIHTTEGLKQHWAGYFLQALMQERFKNSMRETGGVFTNQMQKPFIVTDQTIQVAVHFSEENLLNVLGGLFSVVRDLRSEGFLEEELNELKTKVQRNLFSLNRKVPDNEVLANYYTDQLLSGVELPSFQIFMKMSLNVIAELSLRDIELFAEKSLKVERCQIDIRAPLTTRVVENDVYHVFELFKKELKNEGIGLGILKADGDLQTYFLLSASNEEIFLIGNVIDTVANTSKLGLLAEKSEMDKKKAKINHVHPLRFLGIIFSNPHLKLCMGKIQNDFFKWRIFVGELSARLEEEVAEDNISPYIAGFCQVAQAHPDQVRALIQRKNWEGLLKYLIRLNTRSV